MLVGLLLVTRGGSLLKHTLGVLLLAWRRILLASAAAAIAGVLIGETGAVVITGSIPPPLMAHIVVLIFASVLAYCTALTVFVEEILHGLLNTIRMVEGDAAAGARAAAVIAEREAGEAGSGIMRLFGKRQPPPPQADATARAFVAPSIDPMRTIEAQQSAADFDATEAFITTSPRPRVDARPVRADQLPRIGWAASGPQSATIDESAPVDSATDGGDLGLALPDAQPFVPSELPLESQASDDSPLVEPSTFLVPAQPESSTPPEASVPEPAAATQPPPLEPIPVRTPSVVASDPVVSASSSAPAVTSPTPPAVNGGTVEGERWEPPSAVSVLPPEAASDEAGEGGFGEAARPTRPLSRPSRPLDGAPDAVSGRGIWSRISQALVGNTNAATTPDAPASDSGAPPA